jgi:hypothetical protein
MLLDVMIAAKADGPSVGGFEPCASISVAPDMRALDRSTKASRHAAMMLAHPGAMSRTLAAVRLARALALKPVR